MTWTNFSSDISPLDVIVQLTRKQVDQRHWRQNRDQMGRLNPSLAARSNGQRFRRIAKSSDRDTEPVGFCLGVDCMVTLMEVQSVVDRVQDVTPMNLFTAELLLSKKRSQREDGRLMQTWYIEDDAIEHLKLCSKYE